MAAVDPSIVTPEGPLSRVVRKGTGRSKLGTRSQPIRGGHGQVNRRARCPGQRNSGDEPPAQLPDRSVLDQIIAASSQTMA